LPPVKNKRLHISLWKKRVTLALLVLFCALISSAEHLSKEVHGSNLANQEASSTEKNPTEDQTILTIAVNAVVPVANILSPQLFHFIFEIVLPKRTSIGTFPQKVYTNEYFYKVLFERIISTNAP
jgi:hypothetical protein